MDYQIWMAIKNQELDRSLNVCYSSVESSDTIYSPLDLPQGLERGYRFDGGTH